ncbi:MAG: ABC transporter permease, partial [Phycisphaerae bacterium]|nr:ABC transporter permease [Saprospiraceae bacterium]
INVFGLAFGIASVFLISIYIKGELSYDKFHHEAEDLYRIAWINENPQTRTPHPMAQAMVSDFPEVESAVSLTPLWAAGLTRETHSFRHPDKPERYDEKNLLAVDTTFFDVFDFPIVKGDAKAALKKVNGVLISESMARKYFGDEDPIGKHLAVDSAEYLVEVAAVFKDVPPNSHFHFDFLASYIREKSFNPKDPFYSWADFGHYNYIRLKHGSDPKVLEGKLMDWVTKYIDISPAELNALKEQHFGFTLQPVTDIHLYSRLHWELEPNGNMEYIYILAAAAIFTLIIACVNFMNLTTAKSAERAKEIGVRKSLGALRSQLSIQFLAESVTIALCAIIISIFIIETALPYFNYITGLKFDVHYIQYLMILLGGGLLIGCVAGLYPSLYLSGVKPHLILKGKLLQTPKGSSLRRGLIILQFSISMMLISSAAIIFTQLDYLQSKNLGFRQDEVIVIPVKNEEGMERFDAFRNEMLRVDGVSAVSASSNIPGGQFNQHSFALAERPQDEIDASEAYVDFDFFKALNIEVVEGRLFLRESPSDNGAFI